MKKYAKVHYNEVTDSFELWLKNEADADWGFSRAAKCVPAQKDPDTNYIHFSFMKEIVKCAELGYEVFMG